MIDPRVDRLAHVAVEICAKIRKDYRVVIGGSIAGAPLMTAMYKWALKKGAHPTIRPSLPEAETIFYKYATKKQLEYVSEVAYYEARHVDARLHVWADFNVKELAEVDPAKFTLVRRSRMRLKQLIDKHASWNVILYPTVAFAQEAEMSLSDFEDLSFAACFVDTPDYLRRWKVFQRQHARWERMLTRPKSMRIVSKDTDLRMSLAGRYIRASAGLINIPDGELFTCPVENSVEGHIFFPWPNHYGGKEVTDIYLRFKNGRVVEAKATKNEAFLKEVLNTDAAAQRIGEIGIGTNYEVTRFTKNALIDEKIGGTIHLALGNSYPETGGKNKSAIHWDLVKDLREDGMIYIDDRLFLKNGKIVAT